MSLHASPSPRPAIFATASVPHGAITPAELERLGLKAEQVLDFSVNINPYGPPPGVREALLAAPIARYPDPEALALRRALAHHLDQPVSRILVGNGASELIWLTALAFLEAGDRILIAAPTYGEYARAARIMAAHVIEWRAFPQADFAMDPEAFLGLIKAHAPKIIFLCHPNNPTGQPVPLAALARGADEHPHSLFVVDEAYLPFAPTVRSALTLDRPNILVLRSVTKAYALAGLRLGYAVGPEPLVAALKRMQPPWSVNVMAQAAGLAALGQSRWLQNTLTRLQHNARNLMHTLRDMGRCPHPSATHYALLPVGDASRVRAALLRQGIVVRDATSFGLPHYIRIAARTPAENARLIHALTQLPSDL